MRCHFNLEDAHQTLFDREGVEVEDVDQAYTLAHEVAVEMFRQGQLKIGNCLGWRLEATDGSGVVLFTIRLDALLS
jgi:hypothetical protein